jgi:hypothetical protein
VTLPTVEDALTELSAAAKGYVLWDPQTRASLLVAYTAAGVLDALVAAPSHVPLLQKLGLPLLADFSSRFRGMSDAAVHKWSYHAYWSQANQHQLLWLGGECHGQAMPAMGDFGVSRRLFAADLSTCPAGAACEAGSTSAALERQLADELIGAAAAAAEASGAPPLTVLGWHSYCKDYEHTWVRAVSLHGGRVHGLNTNPNLSFMTHLALPDDFEFRNRPQLPPPPPTAPMPPVAMVFVQTDGIGLGAWTKAGRGSLPYAWEVTLPDLEIQPVLLQMFYEQATPNDTFVAALSGPGYSYPKVTPPSKRARNLALANDMLARLDLHAMVVFDASAADTSSTTVTGDCTLDSSTVNAYAASLPNARALLVGYGPTFTFADTLSSSGANQTTISFDYYLDPARPVADAVGDLVALAGVNPVAPYLLAVHVREYSSVGKMAELLDALEVAAPGHFALLPAHEWLALAATHPTFRSRFR